MFMLSFFHNILVLENDEIIICVMSCDADNYYLYNEMTGYSNNEQCFYKTWNKTVPRYYTW